MQIQDRAILAPREIVFPGQSHSVELSQGAEEDPELSKAEAALGVDGAHGATVLGFGHVLEHQVAANEALVRVEFTLLHKRQNHHDN